MGDLIALEDHDAVAEEAVTASVEGDHPAGANRDTASGTHAGDCMR